MTKISERRSKINHIKSILAELNAIVAGIVIDYDNGLPDVKDDHDARREFKNKMVVPIQDKVTYLVKYLYENFSNQGNHDDARKEIRLHLNDPFGSIDVENLMDYTIRVVALKTAVNSIPVRILPVNLFGDNHAFFNDVANVMIYSKREKTHG